MRFPPEEGGPQDSGRHRAFNSLLMRFERGDGKGSRGGWGAFNSLLMRFLHDIPLRGRAVRRRFQFSPHEIPSTGGGGGGSAGSNFQFSPHEIPPLGRAWPATRALRFQFSPHEIQVEPDAQARIIEYSLKHLFQFSPHEILGSALATSTKSLTLFQFSPHEILRGLHPRNGRPT